jgi:hypothetical protein
MRSGFHGATSAPAQSSYLTPDIVNWDFHDGTLGPFTDFWADGSLTTISDPTGAGKDYVEKIHYAQTSSATPPVIDSNRGCEYNSNNNHPGHFWVSCDYYFPSSQVDFTNTTIQRKLIYLRTNWTPVTMGLVIHLWGGNLYSNRVTDNEQNDSALIATFSPDTWYTINAEITINSAWNLPNGDLKVSINGVQQLHESNVWFANPPSDPSPYNLRYDLMDFGWQREGGKIAQGSPTDETSCDEYRYIDRVRVSSTPIAP